MLPFAQHLASHRERPFAEFTLERSEGLRVTKLYRCWLLKIIIGLYTLPHASLPTSISNTHQTGCAYDFCTELLFVDERSDVHSSYSSDRACPYHVHPVWGTGNRGTMKAVLARLRGPIHLKRHLPLRCFLLVLRRGTLNRTSPGRFVFCLA